MFTNLIKMLKPYKTGFLIGYNIQPLPDNIYKIYNHIFFRVFRVIGGISAVLVLTKTHHSLPLLIQYLVLALGLFQFIQMAIFSFLKSVYLFKKIKNNPEEFEVRNSPLHHFASHFAKLIACWKTTCSVGATGTSVIGTGVLIDNVLDSAGQPKVFDPIFKQVINSVLPDRKTDIEKTEIEVQKSVKNIATKDQEVKFIQEKIINNL